MPVRDRVHSLATTSALTKWGDECAGIVALERGDNVITIFGTIGEDFWDEGITAKSVSRQLRAIGGPVEAHINSPGGDVFEGFAIYNALREHPYPVTVKIIGMAASAASVIAMAGDTVQIGSAAFLMIHNCWVMGIGNRHDLRELADFLEPFDAALNGVYQARTGQSEADISKWLDDETYMSGQMAIDRGFADELLPADATKKDDQQSAKDKSTNDIRAMELTLLASGLTRAQARERIQKIKGTPGAVSDSMDAGTPGASQNDWTKASLDFLAFLQNPSA